MVAVRCPRDPAHIIQRAGGAWEPWRADDADFSDRTGYISSPVAGVLLSGAASIERRMPRMTGLTVSALVGDSRPASRCA
jgi:hypothetical protein